MMIELDWWLTEYVNEIAETLRLKEEGIPTWKAISPQLDCRRFLVDWLSLIGEKLHLRNSSLHLAVHLVDYFMDNRDIPISQLQLMALGCLLIAAKFEEKDSQIPRISELNKFVHNYHSPDEFLKMELTLLDFFDWKIAIPTAAHFIDYFGTEALSPTEYVGTTKSLVSYSNMKVYLQQYIKYFLDISLQDPVFLHFRRSLIAAACIATARMCLKLIPTWTPVLQKITLYSLDQLKSCIEIMLRTLQKEERASKKSKGHSKRKDSSASRTSEIPSSS